MSLRTDYYPPCGGKITLKLIVFFRRINYNSSVNIPFNQDILENYAKNRF